MDYLEQLKSLECPNQQVPIVSKPNIDTFVIGSNRHILKNQTYLEALYDLPLHGIANGLYDSDGLMHKLADACQGLAITPTVVLKALAPEDIDDWRKGVISLDHLIAFARSLILRRVMDQGIRPDHYTEYATCQHCGPVWLWFTGNVQGCPWCWNRVADRPIPRPCSIHCDDCINFERIAHPHLGHCSKGEPEVIAGLRDTDQRYYERFLPRAGQSKSDY